jgi:hypothetical protein
MHQHQLSENTTPEGKRNRELRQCCNGEWKKQPHVSHILIVIQTVWISWIKVYSSNQESPSLGFSPASDVHLLEQQPAMLRAVVPAFHSSPGTSMRTQLLVTLFTHHPLTWSDRAWLLPRTTLDSPGTQASTRDTRSSLVHTLRVGVGAGGCTTGAIGGAAGMKAAGVWLCLMMLVTVLSVCPLCEEAAEYGYNWGWIQSSAPQCNKNTGWWCTVMR